MASEQSIQKFRKIYQKEFGVEITQEQAIEQIAQFLVTARIVFQPMPKEWEGRYNQLLKQKDDSRDLGRGERSKSVGLSHESRRAHLQRLPDDVK
jgi:hypothetical protein